MARIRWSPILDGARRARALAAVAETVARVRGLRTGPASVAFGLSGFALLLLEASRVQPRLASPRDIDRMVMYVLRQVEAQPLSPGLFEGYSGVGLTLELVRRAGSTRVDGTMLDRALLASVERFDEVPPQYASLDLFRGLAGLGLYACSRLPRARAGRALEAIVRWLDRRAIAMSGGMTWLSPPQPDAGAAQIPGAGIDLGIAHGVPGIIAVLARVLEAGIAIRTTRPLLDAATRWLLQRSRPHAAAAFDTIGPGDPAADPGLAWAPAPQLGWCYGDPGTAIALLHAARARRDGGLHDAAMAMLRRIASVRTDPMIEDASLCHGTAGLLHLFNRVYQATGEASARDAAIHWAERTLVVRAGPNPVAGKVPASSLHHPHCFLVGAAGSALALLAAASPIAPVWDTIMLLDQPPQRPPRLRARRSRR